VSIHERFSDSTVLGGVIVNALDSVAAVAAFLPAGSETRLTAVNTNLNWASGTAKRVLDLAVGTPVLAVLAPLLLLIAVLVRLDSPGPVFFRQRRSGLCGRTFGILKFRTMNVLEDGNAVIQARPGDERTTRVGRWLRAWSLDELPQLINVVLGDMSLVGPRPHACAHDEYYSERIAQYRHRQSVKPGLTGWAQVNGLRGPTPTLDIMARRVDFDVWYARHASFGLDLEILVRTPLEVLRRRNAC
jgi:putative colanic acid biosysnthesis UDP-glucose lipid carrier transferase